MSADDRSAAAAKAERRRRFRSGRASELAAALLLACKGYRILARRYQTPLGEIDLVAVRGRRLAFVEVKRRITAAAAEAAITERQRHRIRRAAELWLTRHARYQGHDIAFDVVLVLPRRLPRHLPEAL